jgi:NAD-dependent DNA ligase
MARSMGALLGITQGLLCDGELNDKEIQFLHRWLQENASIASTPPASIIFQRIAAILEDGIITPSERSYLSETLQRFLGGSADDIANSTHVTELGFDSVDQIVFPNSLFCLTGEFAYAERGHCEELIASLGGVIGNVTKKLNYLVVGERGSVEWKHGSFGTKIAKALDYKQRGVPIFIVAENVWASCLRAR